MQVIDFIGRFALALLRLTLTLVLSAGFLVFIVPFILVFHRVERSAPEPSQPNTVPLSPSLMAEPAF